MHSVGSCLHNFDAPSLAPSPSIIDPLPPAPAHYSPTVEVGQRQASGFVDFVLCSSTLPFVSSPLARPGVEREKHQCPRN